MSLFLSQSPSLPLPRSVKSNKHREKERQEGRKEGRKERRKEGREEEGKPHSSRPGPAVEGARNGFQRVMRHLRGVMGMFALLIGVVTAWL